MVKDCEVLMIDSLIEEVKSWATIYTSYSNREAFQAPPMELCKYRPSWWEPFLDAIWGYSLRTCILMTCDHALKRWIMDKGPPNCSIVCALTTSFTSSTVETMCFDAQQCAYQYSPTCKLIPVQLIHYHETTMSNLHDSQFIFPPSALD